MVFAKSFGQFDSIDSIENGVNGCLDRIGRNAATFKLLTFMLDPDNNLSLSIAADSRAAHLEILAGQGNPSQFFGCEESSIDGAIAITTSITASAAEQILMMRTLP